MREYGTRREEGNRLLPIFCVFLPLSPCVLGENARVFKGSGLSYCGFLPIWLPFKAFHTWPYRDYCGFLPICDLTTHDSCGFLPIYCGFLLVSCGFLPIYCGFLPDSYFSLDISCAYDILRFSPHILRFSPIYCGFLPSTLRFSPPQMAVFSPLHCGFLPPTLRFSPHISEFYYLNQMLKKQQKVKGKFKNGKRR